MQEKMYELLMAGQEKYELQRVLSCNERTSQFGLALTEEDAKMLMQCRYDTLKDQRRVEFGEGILPKLIEVFCDSQYLEQEDYSRAIAELQEIFYQYKNESKDLLTDDELLTFMREQLDGVSYGSLEYLRDTCLERFTQAVKAGYTGYEKSQGKGEYLQFSEEKHWDRQLYWDTLWDLLG